MIARTLLEHGADTTLLVQNSMCGGAATDDGALSALDEARRQQAEGGAPPESAAALLLLEGEGWTMAHRRLMPAVARARAAALAWVGATSCLPSDAWSMLIIPRVLRAEFGCGV